MSLIHLAAAIRVAATTAATMATKAVVIKAETKGAETAIRVVIPVVEMAAAVMALETEAVMETGRGMVLAAVGVAVKAVAAKMKEKKTNTAKTILML